MRNDGWIVFATNFFIFSVDLTTANSQQIPNIGRTLSENSIMVDGYDYNKFPQGLGWIERVDMPPCSAALIGSDIVLTKASCLYTNYGGSHEPWWHIDDGMLDKSRFNIGNGNEIITAKIRNYTASNDYIYHDNKKSDLMFIKLDEKIGDIAGCSKIQEKLLNQKLSLFYFKNSILPGYEVQEFKTEYIARQCMPGKKIKQINDDSKYECLKQTYDNTFFFSDGILYSKRNIVGLNGVDRNAIPASTILAHYRKIKDTFQVDDNAKYVRPRF